MCIYSDMQCMHVLIVSLTKAVALIIYSSLDARSGKSLLRIDVVFGCAILQVCGMCAKCHASSESKLVQAIKLSHFFSVICLCC